MLENVKEFFKNVDWKSAGIGAGLTLVGIGAYKGVKFGIKAANNAYKAMKAAKNAGMSELNGENQNSADEKKNEETKKEE